jgi:hypothetical protein
VFRKVVAASTTSETSVPVPVDPVGTGADADAGVEGDVDPGSDGEVDPGFDGDALLDGSDWTDAAFALAYNPPPRRAVAAAKAATTFRCRPRVLR